MLSKKALTTVLAEYGWLNGMKWANFKNLSTTIKITDLPPTFGNPSMKSIEMSFHTWYGMTESAEGQHNGGDPFCSFGMLHNSLQTAEGQHNGGDPFCSFGMLHNSLRSHVLASVDESYRMMTGADEVFSHSPHVQ
jgi:hypothetical protein